MMSIAEVTLPALLASNAYAGSDQSLSPHAFGALTETVTAPLLFP